MLTVLINEIAAIRKDFALVLDDYHVIANGAVHGMISSLVDHLPPQAHLIIVSRVDPPLSPARLRARGQMIEIRAEDLRFTPEETAAFLQGTMGLDLPGESIVALEERTEGWIVGLQLAALSVRGREDVSGFITALRGSSRYVLDYLAEEVLRCQPEDVRAFLLRTSILDRLSGPLCDAVTDGADSGISAKEVVEDENSDPAGYGDRDAPLVCCRVDVGRRHPLLVAPAWHPVRGYWITFSADASPYNIGDEVGAEFFGPLPPEG